MNAPATPEILQKTLSGERLSFEDAVTLLEEGNLLELGAAADEIRRRQNDPGVATYMVDRNINYTNVCIYRCQFCAFYRPSSTDPDAYVLTFDQIGEKIQETIDLGGTGILLQGGVDAELPFTFYEDMFRFIRKTFPTIHLHALSAPEVYFLQKITKWQMHDVIARLRDAGLQSIPGGGAEILEDSVRRRIWSLTKAPTEKWVGVHESAHGLGMRTTATMMFGVGETYRDRVTHFQVVRDLQDRTGGFTAWIPWTFQKENTVLDGKVEEAGGFEYLKTLAVSRLFLDNIRHVQGSWVTQGPKIGQVSLSFGADDLGSIMIEENVVYAAGARNRMTQEEMRRLIADAGYAPVQRRTLYDACKDPCCTSPIPVPKATAPMLPIAGSDVDSSVASA
ncbi:MAG TPA: cyclic dehypoxanthinyl futalosine synthase [Thermoanaerobaculia bacterium]|nr:cyclic dehypoxanthinyl futalosine synthase [Thermoanaerobaculia bacterium]